MKTAEVFGTNEREVTVGELLDTWVDECLLPGKYSNGTVISYRGVVNRMKSCDIADIKLSEVTPDILQKFVNGLFENNLSTGYLRNIQCCNEKCIQLCSLS